MRTLVAGLRWGEGPRFDGARFYVSDPHSRTLWVVESGAWSVHRLATPTNGLGIMPDGTLVAALMDDLRIGRWDGEGFQPFADLRGLAQGPLGDMVIDAHGGIYVDDVGYAAHRGEAARPGRVIYVEPGGVAARVVAEQIEFPNGLALLDSGRTLVVAETWRQRLVAFDVGAGGALTGRRLYADLAAAMPSHLRESGAGAWTPDGICASDDHGVWVATLTGQCLLKIEDGQILDLVDTGPEHPVAVCADADGRLYATLASAGDQPLMEAVKQRTVTTRLAEITLPDHASTTAGH